MALTTVSRHNLERNAKTGNPGEKLIGERVVDLLNDISRIKLGGYGEYLLVLNKRSMNSPNKFGTDKARRITTKQHGSNEYQHYKAIAILAATNPEPAHAKWLSEATGLSLNEVYEAYNIDTAYQALGRCAIRNRDNTEIVRAIVLSRKIAELLHEIFPGSKLRGKWSFVKSYKDIWKSVSGKDRGRPKSESALRRNKRYNTLQRQKNRLLNNIHNKTATEIDKEKLMKVVSEMEQISVITKGA